MFQLYLRLGSAAEVATRVNALGWTRKLVKARAGHSRGGGPWDEKDVQMLLRNPLCIGKVDFKGALYDGEHGQRRRATTYLQPEDGFEPWAPQPGYFRVLWRAYARLGFDVAPLATAAGVEP
jgi:hypothetical protein